jgi:hypothetical protein
LAEPSAITWGRQEVARKLHREGVHLTAIAEQVGASTEQVQQWISLDSKPNSVIEAYRRGMLPKYYNTPGVASGFCQEGTPRGGEEET